MGVSDGRIEVTPASEATLDDLRAIELQLQEMLVRAEASTRRVSVGIRIALTRVQQEIHKKSAGAVP
jgi:hypothetical protein